MENSLKGLLLAAGVAITLVVLSLGFLISREAQDVSAQAVGQINGLTKEFSNADKNMYEGLKISGKEVLKVINRYENQKDFTIKVITHKTKDGFTSFTGSKEVKSENYINPDAQFLGQVDKDANDVITGLTFTQQ